MYLSYFFFHYIVIINSIMRSLIHVIYKHPFIKICIYNYIIYTNVCINCIYLAPYGEDMQCLLPNPVNNMFIYIIKYVIIFFF